MALHSKLWDEIAHEETNTTIRSIKEEMRELKKSIISKKGNQDFEIKKKKGGVTHGYL